MFENQKKRKNVEIFFYTHIHLKDRLDIEFTT